MNISIAEPDGRFALAEANHRFLNSLSSLGGLLRKDFGELVDPAIHDAVRLFSSRIRAFAGVHQTLGEPSRDILVDAPTYLARLCAELCEAHLAPRGLFCEFTSDPGVLSRETCQTLSLIVVELVTNAAKHAFTGRASGRVRISLQRDESGWLCLVADNGSGLRGGPGGDGMRLIRRLADSLGGSLGVQSSADGVMVALWMPEDPATQQADVAQQPCQA